MFEILNRKVSKLKFTIY